MLKLEPNNPFQRAYAFVRNARQRRRQPARFIQNGTTPYRVVFESGIMAVRHYENPDKRHRVPVLLTPPLGINTWVFDLLGTRSIVKYLIHHGYDVYLIDWGVPDDSHKHLSLAHYTNEWLPRAIDAVEQHSNHKELSLVGYCLGGLLCILYLSITGDSRVRNLITIASPIDFHGSGRAGQMLSLISKPALAIHDKLNLSLTKLSHRYFHVPGNLLSIGFKMTNPMGSLAAYLELVKNLSNKEYVTEHMSVGAWFNDMPDYPGATVQDIVAKFGLANLLSRGKLYIGDKKADFSRISANLLAFAGETDNIVSVGSAQRILDLVSSKDMTFHVKPGGHAGVFAGGGAMQHTWQTIVEWLASRSA